MSPLVCLFFSESFSYLITLQQSFVVDLLYTLFYGCWFKRTKNTVGRSEEFTSATNWNVTQLTTHTNRRPSQLFRQVVKILRSSVFLAMVWKYVPCRSKSNASCAFKDRRHILLRHNLSTNGVVFTLADGNRTKRISKVKHQ